MLRGVSLSQRSQLCGIGSAFPPRLAGISSDLTVYRGDGVVLSAAEHQHHPLLQLLARWAIAFAQHPAHPATPIGDNRPPIVVWDQVSSATGTVTLTAYARENGWHGGCQ